MDKKSLIYQKKKKALDLFVKNLLKTPAGKDIERIILFGSLAKGDVDEYSDVDVLLFTKRPASVREVVWEATLDAYEKYQESVEPMVFPLKKFKNPDSYFLYYSINKGKQLYPPVKS